MAQATELATGYISLAVSTKGLGRQVAREFSGVESEADKAGKRAGNKFGAQFGGVLKAGALGAAVAGALAVKGLGSAISAAGELEQSVGGVQAVFKDYAKNISASSKQAATAVGLSENAYNQLAATIGSTLKNKGIKDFGKQTETLIGLGADLASQFGGSTQEAVDALSSALRGESDPIERYGVSLNQAAIGAEAMALGLAKPIKNTRDIGIAQQRATVAQAKYNAAVKEFGKDSIQATSAQASLGSAQKALEKAASGVTPELNDQQKAMAALSLINKQTASAQGNFARETDTLAGKQAAAAAQFENLKAAIGNAFLPAASAAMGFISKTMLPAFARLTELVGPKLQSGFKFARSAIETFTGAFTIGGMDQFSGSLLKINNVGVRMGETFRVAAPLVVGAFRSVVGFIRSEFVPRLLSIGAAVRQLAAVVLPIIRQVVVAFLQEWPKIQPVVVGIFRTIGGIVTNVMSIIKGQISTVTKVVQFIWSRWGKQITRIVTTTFKTVVGVLSGAFTIIGGLVEVVTGLMTGDFRKAGEGVKKTIRGVAKVLKSVFAGIKSNIATVTEGIRKRIAEKFNAVKKKITDTITGARDTVKGLLSTGANGVRGIFNTATEAVRKKVSEKFTAIRDKITGTIRSARDTVKTILGAGKNGLQSVFSTAVGGIRTIWDGLKAIAKAPVKFIVETVINNGLLGAFRKISEIVGYDAGKNLTVALPPGFHDGGYTGKVHPRKIAGVVHGDEQVIRSKSRRKIERMAPGYLDYLNEHGRIPGYAKGGRVSWKGHSFSSLFAGRLQQAEKMSGATFNIFQGGFRPTTDYSGTSHRGDAIDLGPIRSTVIKALRQVGIAAWDRTGKGNWAPHIHAVPTPGAGYAGGSAIWQAQDYLRGGDGLGGRDNGPRVNPISGLGDAGGGFVGDLFDAVGALKEKFTGPLDKLKSLGSAPFVKMVSGIPGMVKDALLDKAKSFVGSVLDGPSVPGDTSVGGSNRKRGLALMMKAGFGVTHWPALNKLWTKESGWNERAKNPSSGAYGIPQSLPGSKMASVGSDWQTNPNTQIRWGLGYIKDRYGTPSKAWKHSQQFNWYDNGGYLKPGATMTMNATSKPEPVLTNHQWATMSTLADRGMTQPASGVTVMGDVYGATPAQMVAELEKQARRKAAVQIIR